MPKQLSIGEIRKMMDRRGHIRNISIIAHVDHGKSTLTDSLIGHAGIIAQAKAGDTRFMDTREDEQARTITIKSTSVSLFFKMPHLELEERALKDMDDKKDILAAIAKYDEDMKAFKESKEEGEAPAPEAIPFLVNLIDSPGHVDFSSEVTAALRVTDGALVVVDCIEGVCVQTETVLRQALSERIMPVLFVNKLDRVFLELKMDLEEAYRSFQRAVESVNVVIATYEDSLLGDVQVRPEIGTVGFGSGLHGWGFTIRQFAHAYARKTGTGVDKWSKRLWGPHFYNPRNGRWGKKPTSKDGKENVRGFVKFILEPINSLFKAVISDKVEVYSKMLDKLNVKIPKDAVEKELTGKALLKRIMQTWLPAADSLLQMICNYLPSPVSAQRYRVENLYSGPLDDPCATAIKECDPNGPLMMYVSKMVPTSEKGRFYAFGRVFAGKIKTGQTVRIMGPDFELDKKKDLFIKKVQRTVLMMGRYTESLSDCPCGNLIGLSGIDSYLLKSGTLSTYDRAHPIVTMKYSVSPVVRVAVEVVNASDLPKLVEGLKRLTKSDPLVQCTTSKTGEHIIAGAGELHLEVCLKDLENDFMKGAKIRKSTPIVSFCETILSESSQTVIAKSPNKHNRVYLTAQPLSDKFCKAVEEGEVKENEEVKARAKRMAENYENWDVADARKIWAFGCPPDSTANVFVDQTKGVQYLNECKDYIKTAFIQASMGGVLADEILRGVRFDLQDVTLHADAIHRGAGQMMPCTRAAVYGAQLASEPSLLEPLYKVNITVPNTFASGVFTTLGARRGVVDDKQDRIGTPLTNIIAFLPVMESFGFTELLRKNTSGQAFPQMIFSHWEPVSGDVQEAGTPCNTLVSDIRKRKGMKATLPQVKDYHERV